MSTAAWLAVVTVAGVVFSTMGFLGAAMLANGAHSEQLAVLSKRAREREEAARKEGYDQGWDSRDLLEKRKRQAAAHQAVQTRRRNAS